MRRSVKLGRVGRAGRGAVLGSVLGAAVLGLGLTACGGSSPTAKSVKGAHGGSTSSSQPAPGPQGGATTSSTAGPGPTVTAGKAGGGGTSAGGGAAGGTAAAGSNGYTQGTGRVSGGQPGASPSYTSTVGPAPIARGTYRYHQSGTFQMGTSSGQVPPEGTLVVDAPQAAPPSSGYKAGAQTQATHRYVDPKQAPSDVNLLFDAQGMYITSETLRQSVPGGGTVSFTCTLNQPAPTPPTWPPANNTEFKGSANCGSFQATFDETVKGTGTAKLADGSSYPYFVVNTVINTSGALVATINETDWFAPSLRLSLQTTEHTNGKYGSITFSSNTQSVLESGKPT